MSPAPPSMPRNTEPSTTTPAPMPVETLTSTKAEQSG